MSRVRRYLRSVRVTPVGWLLLAGLIASFLLSLLGPKSVQAPAFLVFLLIAIALGGSSLRLSWSRGARARVEHAAPDEEAREEPADDEIWQRQRERFGSGSG